MFLHGPRPTNSGIWAFAADGATFPSCSPSTAAGEVEKLRSLQLEDLC
jgi:hypothetical protein